VMSLNIIEGVFFFRILSLGCFFFGSLNEVVRYYCSYQREISKANISFVFCLAGSSFGSSRLSLLGILLVLLLEEVLMFQRNCIYCD